MSNDPWKAQLEALGALLRAQRRAADLSLRELSERTRAGVLERAEGDGEPRMREAEAAILRDAA